MNRGDMALVNKHGDYVRGEMDTSTKQTIRDRLGRLHDLLSEALAIQAILIGQEPEGGKQAEQENSVLSSIECSLDTAIDKASSVVSRLQRLEERL